MKNRDAAEGREVVKLQTRLKKSNVPLAQVAEATTALRRTLEAQRRRAGGPRHPGEGARTQLEARGNDHLPAKIEFVILEEAHKASGEGFYEIMRHCVNAHYRLALMARRS
jgi:superfamily II DNA or RNA helicase